MVPIMSLHLLDCRQQESDGALGRDDGAVVQADEADVGGDDEQDAEPGACVKCYNNSMRE